MPLERLAVRKIGQSATRLMQKASSVLGSRGHTKLPDIHGVDGRKVDTATLANLAQQRTALFSGEPFARKQAAKQGIRAARVDLGHQVDQQLRLRGIVRRVLGNAENTHHAVDQVVERWPEVGRATVISSPAIKAEPVVLVFFQRGGVENAQNLVTDFNRFDMVAGFSGSEPVESVDILQNGK